VGNQGFPHERKAPRCGSGGFWVFAGRFLRGDDPEALALRPSHYLRASSPSLARPLHPVSLASGWVQGGRNIDMARA
jgi:hypothetical protein